MESIEPEVAMAGALKKARTILAKLRSKFACGESGVEELAREIMFTLYIGKDRRIIQLVRQIENGKRLECSQKLIGLLNRLDNLLEMKISYKIERKIISEKRDNPNRPFMPTLTEKPNSLVEYNIDDLITGTCEHTGMPTYKNPYSYEIANYEVEEKWLKSREVVRSRPLVETPLYLVNDRTTFEDMMEDLSEVDIIGLDTEHHKYRTYEEYVCLIQISTREGDYIVDAVTLKEEVKALQDIFTNPRILKVAHGSSTDIQLLQKSFVLYIVNLFDTAEADVVLRGNNSSRGIATLIQELCGVTINKKHDGEWRQRPLKAGQLNYARGDTHYLLEMCDQLTNRILLQQGRQGLENTFARGRKLCSMAYENKVTGENSYTKIIRSRNGVFDRRETLVLQKLFNWRDEEARRNDESTTYIMPHDVLMRLVRGLPREVSQVEGIYGKQRSFTPGRGRAVHQLILGAIDRE